MFKQKEQKYQWRYQFLLLRMNKRAEVYRAYEHCTHEAEKNETAAPVRVNVGQQAHWHLNKNAPFPKRSLDVHPQKSHEYDSHAMRKHDDL
jgi:hypothetical protein